MIADDLDVDDIDEQVAYLTQLTKSANYAVREQAQDLLDRLALVDLEKVGPKGYIHGWIFVGPQAAGARVFHPEHGHGTITRSGKRTVGVKFDSGKEHAFEHAKGSGEHFAQRIDRRRRSPGSAEVHDHLDKAREAMKAGKHAEAADHLAAALGASHPDDRVLQRKVGRVRAAAARAVAKPKAKEPKAPEAPKAAPDLHRMRREMGLDHAHDSAVSESITRAHNRLQRGEDPSKVAADLRQHAKSHESLRDEMHGEDTPEINQNKQDAYLLNRLASGLERHAADSKPAPKTVDAEREKLAKEFVLRMAAGEKFSADEEMVPHILKELDGHDPVNMAMMQIKGRGNGNLFQKHMRDIPRDQMPALPDNVHDLQPFMDALVERNVKFELVHMDPREIKATQSQLSGPKVAKLAGFMTKGGWKAGGALIVSRENALLDGHHRWAGAAMASLQHKLGVPGAKPVNAMALKVDLPIDELLKIGEEFSGPKKALTEAP